MNYPNASYIHELSTLADRATTAILIFEKLERYLVVGRKLLLKGRDKRGTI